MLNLDLLHELRRAGLEIRTDDATRVIYSTDASLYQITPLGVGFPRTLDHLNAAVELAAKYRVPVLARGAGSSLAGQAVGEALILDCSRYLNKIHEVHKNHAGADGWVTAEPGAILRDINRAAAPHGLMIGPDPASADRATLGGSLANNASGAHSIVYGMFADHVVALETIFGNGEMETLTETAISALKPANLQPSTINAFYAAALDIRSTLADEIRARWPRTYRRAAGYNLNYLLPWSPSAPPQFRPPSSVSGQAYPPISPNHINLAHLLVGSEGTLGVIRQATIRLVPKPRHTVLAVLAFNSIEQACDETPRLLEHQPSAIELIPRVLLELAASVPAYARMLDFIPPPPSGSPHNWGEDHETPFPAALLAIEFAGDNTPQLLARARALRSDALIAKTPQAQSRVWAVRKAGLGILQSQPGDLRTHTFIEDITVPADRLGDYVRAMDAIAADHNTQFYYYAHASAGCLHMRPLLNLKTTAGQRDLRQIAQEAVRATIALGGTTTGEHGDGLARSEWLEQLYGPKIVEAFRELKLAADPLGILNPGKIVTPSPMDTNLRYGPNYSARGWATVMSFDSQDGITGAIEMCNGAGVCRGDSGVMCPSFQATREEMHSTRGRANLLRALISRQPSAVSRQLVDDGRPTTDDVFNALDLCLACKGCKSDCPSLVDMAKLKYEFTHHYYQSRRRKLSDYVFGYIGELAKLGSRFRRLGNWVLGLSLLNWALGLAPQRKLPRLQGSGDRAIRMQAQPLVANPQLPNTCIYLPDAFTRYFYPDDETAALDVLGKLGFDVKVLPVVGAGRTLISRGFLDAAKRHAAQVVDAISECDPTGELPIIGLEPSEIYTLRDEFPDLFPDDERVNSIARRAWMIDEFIIRQPGSLPASVVQPLPSVLLHGHCYQKAQPPADDSQPVGVQATVAMLKAAGYTVEVIDSGCCGMAGAFGYEAKHYELSMQVGELKLFPAVRSAGETTIIAAPGVSCQSQIADGAHRQAIHPIQLLARSLV